MKKYSDFRDDGGVKLSELAGETFLAYESTWLGASDIINIHNEENFRGVCPGNTVELQW